MNTKPIRERILEKIPSRIEQQRGDLIVVGYDISLIQLGSTSLWVLLVEAQGYLLAADDHLSYVYAFRPLDPAKPAGPRQPLDAEIDVAVNEACTKLRGMRQMQKNLAMQQKPKAN